MLLVRGPLLGGMGLRPGVCIFRVPLPAGAGQPLLALPLGEDGLARCGPLFCSTSFFQKTPFKAGTGG